MKLYAFVGLMAYFVLGCAQGNALAAMGSSREGDIIIIHLYPFEMTSHTAITISNIDRAAICEVEVSADGELALALIDVISSARSGDFEDLFVKMKVDVPGPEVFYVDAQGGVLTAPTNREKRLKSAAFKSLKGLLEHSEEFRPCRERYNR